MTQALASAGADVASTDVDVAIIGAGVAGLAASAALRRAGRSVVVLEASSQIGGRARTSYSEALAGASFDEGAHWLHDARHNPLAALAQRAGERVAADQGGIERAFIDGRAATAAELAEYEAAGMRWRKAVETYLDGPDISLHAAGACMAHDPWAPTLEFWEGAIIAAADADMLSLRDWHANALSGENWVAPGGLGAMLGRLLGPRAGPVRLGATTAAISHRGGHIAVETAQGTLRAGAVIVTVSTGVLRSEAIAFSPAMPNAWLAALEGLPMGQVRKIGLRAKTSGRLGLPPGSDAFRRLRRHGEPAASLLFWSDAPNVLTAFIGGRAATLLDQRAAANFVSDEVGAMFGADAQAGFAAEGFVTEWEADPHFRGAYAYATPGHAGARTMLGSGQWDGRLIFAGEAAAPGGLAGTVAGAFLSGEAAAAALM